MKFYILEDVKSGDSIISKGVDISRMGKAFKVLDKKSENKDVDSIMEFDFIFLESPYSFVSENNLIFSHSSKSLTFALVKNDSIFEFKDKKNTYYAALHDGEVKIQSNKDELEKIISIKTVTSNDPIETKALNWLDNGRVGSSSATMCGVLFPNLRNHHKLADNVDYDDNFKISWPHDNSDFDRCMKFLEAVPEAKSRLSELSSLSKEWEGLVSNWDKIESLINNKQSDEAYDLIKESLGQKRRNKP
jgi:hypothetical protein